VTGEVKVNDAKWKAILKTVAAMKSASVRVGVMGDAGDEKGVSLAEIAAFHEFGTSTIPERSFLRSTFHGHAAEELKTMCAKLSKAIVEGKMDEPRALGLLGLWAVSQVRKTIRAGIAPELAASTIAAKKSSLALVDTGQLLNSLTHVVEP
jgi:phage gpG-like protein